MPDMAYCDMCGSRWPIGRMRWVTTDEYGPVYRCARCDEEDRAESDYGWFPDDSGVSDADPGL